MTKRGHILILSPTAILLVTLASLLFGKSEAEKVDDLVRCGLSKGANEKNRSMISWIQEASAHLPIMPDRILSLVYLVRINNGADM